MKLDLSRFQTVGAYDGIQLSSIPLLLRGAVDDMARAGLIKPNNSFGYAFGHIRQGGIPLASDAWDDPYNTTWFVGGWGPKRDQYIANAVRKKRAGLREGEDTLTMRILHPANFRDQVEKVEPDGSYEWGDFPWGGFTFVRVGDLIVPSAVSCLYEVEDDALAKLSGGLLGAEVIRYNDPTEFGRDS